MYLYVSGGTFKVYAHTTFPEVPYKTLLVSINTIASDIIREALEKFGALKANPADFCLAKVGFCLLTLSLTCPVKNIFGITWMGIYL